MIAFFLAAAIVAGTSVSPVEHFRPMQKEKLPAGFLGQLCVESKNEEESRECRDDFRRTGALWAGDLNGDGIDEFIIDPGGMPGTMGPPRFLVEQKRDGWKYLACLGGPEERQDDGCEPAWNTLYARFDILPTVRTGYHDLRIEVDHCLKWDGEHYIDYDPEDYAKLPLAWFDVNDSREAELFWKIRYGDNRVLRLEPMWFPVPSKEFDRPPRPYLGFPVRVIEFPRLPYVAKSDSKYRTKWLSFFKGGVWGVRGHQAFLLVPQPSYLGAQRLELDGEWLLIYGELEEPKGQPDIRYNRRTQELRFEEWHDK